MQSRGPAIVSPPYYRVTLTVILLLGYDTSESKAQIDSRIQVGKARSEILQDRDSLSWVDYRLGSMGALQKRRRVKFNPVSSGRSKRNFVVARVLTGE